MRGLDGAVVERVDRHRRRDLLLKLRQHLLDVVDHFDCVGAGLPLNGEHDGAIAVVPAGGRCSATLSITLPSSFRRTGAPLR